jgi:hypothetical protein
VAETFVAEVDGPSLNRSAHSPANQSLKINCGGRADAAIPRGREYRASERVLRSLFYAGRKAEHSALVETVERQHIRHNRPAGCERPHLVERDRCNGAGVFEVCAAFYQHAAARPASQPADD